MIAQQENRTLVCDIGSSSIKVGIAGKLTPDKIIPGISYLISKEYGE